MLGRRRRRRASIRTALGQYLVFDGIVRVPADTKHLYYIYTRLDQRRTSQTMGRRCIYVYTCFVFARVRVTVTVLYDFMKLTIVNSKLNYIKNENNHS